MMRLIFLVVILFTVAACEKTPQEPPGGEEQPTGKEKAVKDPKELIANIEKQPMPALKSANDVEKFVAWASQAPVTKRDIIRERISNEKSNKEIANGLITLSKRNVKADHSMALVALSLLGELRSESGFQYLNDFVWQKLPNTGPRNVETNVPLDNYNQILLQVKAVNGMAYMRTATADQAVLKVIASHPTAAVRAEAIAAFLYNHKFSDTARKQLLEIAQKKDRIYIDRPIRTESMSVAEFNKSIQLYLKNHPELIAPSPEKLTRPPGKETPSEPKLDEPPSF